MRKWIVIGGLAIVGFGVLLFVISQPEEDSIEYHRKRYIAEYQGWVWEQELANKVRKVVGQKPRWHTNTNRMEHHERALIRLGYLDERTVIVSNCLPDKVRATVYKAATNWLNGPGLLRVEVRETNKVKIVATTRDVPGLEEAARKADVPESEK